MKSTLRALKKLEVDEAVKKINMADQDDDVFYYVVANLIYQCMKLMNRPDLSNKAHLKFIYDSLMTLSKEYVSGERQQEPDIGLLEDEYKDALFNIFSRAHLLSAFEMATFWYHVVKTPARFIAKNFPGGDNLVVVNKKYYPLYTDTGDIFDSILHDMQIRTKLDTFFVMEQLARELNPDWVSRLPNCNAICYNTSNPWLPSRARVRIYFPTEEDLILGRLSL